MSNVKTLMVIGCFFIGGFAWAPQSEAVDFLIIQYRGQRVLLIKDEDKSERFPRGGMIQFGDAKRLEALLREAGPIAEVLFHSGGGSEPDGIEMGRIIRRRGLSTRIPAKAYCASACADAFLGGVARRVDDGGRYGIHMPTAVGNPETVRAITQEIYNLIDPKEKTFNVSQVRQIIQFVEKQSAHMASRWAAYVLEMGASHRIVDAGTRIEAGAMKWLTRKELVDFNVVNVDD